MLWFLRLFPSFQFLEKELTHQRTLADEATRRAERAEEALRAKEESLEDALRRTTDSFSRMATGRTVFAAASDSATAFPRPNQDHVLQGRRFARDEVQRRTAEFFRRQAEAAVGPLQQMPDQPPAADVSLDELMKDAG